MYQIRRDGNVVYNHHDIQEIVNVFFNYYTFSHRENTQENNYLIAAILNQLAEDTKTDLIIEEVEGE
jgi:hypothetical protein